MKRGILFHSFRHAYRGLRLAFRSEQNFRVQVAVALLVTALMFIFPVSTVHRLFLLIVMMVVFVLELLNSSVERLVDLIRPRLDDQVREVKDIMAGAVFVAALFAAVIGLAIFAPFIPKLFLLL